MLSRSKLFNTFLPAPFMWLKLLETLFGLRFLLLLVIEQIAKKDIFKAFPHFYGSRIGFFWPLATGEHCLFLQVLGHRGISGMEKFKSKDVFRKVWQKFATKIKHNSSNWPKRLKLTLVKLLFTSNDSGSFPLLKTQHQPAWSSGSWLTWKEERSSLSHYWWTRSLWALWAQTTSWQPFGPRRHWTLRACVTSSFAAFGGSGCVTHATVIG